jgi:hypothetical protein
MPVVDVHYLAIFRTFPRVFGSMLHAVASKIVVILEDDVDGSAATETVSFGLDGIAYEIDLSAANAAELREALAPYVKAVQARPADDRDDRKPGTRSPRTRTTNLVDPAAIRVWAASNGITVSSRGRISADVIRQYHEAGN